MDPSRGGDSRYNLNYSMNSIGLSLADQTDIYGNAASVAALSGRPPGGTLIQPMGVGLSSRNSNLINTSQCSSLLNSNTGGSITSSPSNHQRGLKRMGSDCYEDHHQQQHHRSSGNISNLQQQSLQNLDSCNTGGNSASSGHLIQSNSNVAEVDETYGTIPNKKSPPANGKKTKGRVKIKMEYIDNKLRRYTTFSKRKTGIMKKAYELSTLTGTQVMLLVASETGHVYTFATRKLQPMITSEAGKQLIQTCLNSPDPPSVGGGDQRMSATGFEETELSYNIADEDSKDLRSPLYSGNESEDSSDAEQAEGVDNNKSSPDCNFNSSIETNTNKVQNQLVETNAKKSDNENKAGKSETILVDSKLNEKNINWESVPQDVLFQLVQSGHLQLHSDEDGNGQYISIPLPTLKSGDQYKNNKSKSNSLCYATTSPYSNASSILELGTVLNKSENCNNLYIKQESEKS